MRPTHCPRGHSYAEHAGPNGLPGSVRCRLCARIRAREHRRLLHPIPRKPGFKPGDVAERFWSKVDKSGDCWLWTATTVKGYGYFRINSPRTKVYAHRMAYELAKGPVPPDLCVCHTCDNPICVKPDHLWLGTIGDNNRDAVRKGRHSRTLIHGR